MILGVTEPIPSTIDELIGPELAARLDRLDLHSAKLLAGKLPGERRSKRRGRSVEFDDFRDYVPGDDLRHIDWNVLARLDKLFIKLFREDEDLALHVVVDASPSMLAGRPDKLTFAHRVAMALAYVGVVKQNRVSIGTFGISNASQASSSGLRQLAPVRGRTGARRVAEFLLEGLRQAGSATNAGASASASAPRPGGMLELNGALRTLAQSLSGRGGRGIVVVISDFLTPDADPATLAPGLNALAGNDSGGFDTTCLQVLAPGEIDPRKEAERGLIGDLRLTDAESGASKEVTISPALIARYRAAVDRYVLGVARACRGRGIAHVLVPSDTPADQLVLGTLRRAGMLR